MNYDVNRSLLRWSQALVAAYVLFPSSWKLVCNLIKGKVQMQHGVRD